MLQRYFVLAIISLSFVTAELIAGGNEKYPIDAQLKVLEADVKNPVYRKLVLEKMLITDIAAEWQRVATTDNADSFLEKHGGKEKVLGDADLKKAYERRVKIRADYLELMREGYRKYKQIPPFDKGAKAEPAGTSIRESTYLPFGFFTLVCTTVRPLSLKNMPNDF